MLLLYLISDYRDRYRIQIPVISTHVGTYVTITNPYKHVVMLPDMER